jgi:hypothetical protein
MPKIDITMNTDIIPLKMVVSGQVLTADVGEGSNSSSYSFLAMEYILHRILPSPLSRRPRGRRGGNPSTPAPAPPTPPPRLAAAGRRPRAKPGRWRRRGLPLSPAHGGGGAGRGGHGGRRARRGARWRGFGGAVTSHRRRSWLVAAPLGGDGSPGGAAAWEIWPAVAAWHGGGASQRSRQWSGCGRSGTWMAAGGAGRRGRGARPRPGSGPVGPDLGWPGPALACFRGFRGSPPPGHGVAGAPDPGRCA